jgi:hypothetical protein
LKSAAAKRMRAAPRFVPVRTQSCALAFQHASAGNRKIRNRTREWGIEFLFRGLMPNAVLSLYDKNSTQLQR